MEWGAGSGQTRPSSPGRGVCDGSGGGRGHGGGTNPRHVRDMSGVLGPGWRGTWPRRAPGRTTARYSWGAWAPSSAATSSSTSSSGSWRGAPSTRRADTSPPPEIAPEVTRDLARDHPRSHEITQDRARSHEITTGAYRLDRLAPQAHQDRPPPAAQVGAPLRPANTWPTRDR